MRIAKVKILTTLDLDSKELANLINALPTGTKFFGVGPINVSSYEEMYFINDAFRDIDFSKEEPPEIVHSFTFDVIENKYKFDTLNCSRAWDQPVLSGHSNVLHKHTNIQPMVPVSCYHSWVTYTGLTDTFEYCEHCSQRKYD